MSNIFKLTAKHIRGGIALGFVVLMVMWFGGAMFAGIMFLLTGFIFVAAGWLAFSYTYKLLLYICSWFVPDNTEEEVKENKQKASDDV